MRLSILLLSLALPRATAFVPIFAGRESSSIGVSPSSLSEESSDSEAVGSDGVLPPDRDEPAAKIFDAPRPTWDMEPDAVLTTKNEISEEETELDPQHAFDEKNMMMAIQLARDLYVCMVHFLIQRTPGSISPQTPCTRSTASAPQRRRARRSLCISEAHDRRRPRVGGWHSTGRWSFRL